MATEGQEMLRCTDPGKPVGAKGYTIGSRRGQSHVDLWIAVCEANIARAAKLSVVKPDATDAPTSSVGGGKCFPYEVSGGRSIARGRSGMAHDTDAHLILRFRSVQAITALKSVCNEKNVAEKPLKLVGDAVDNDGPPVAAEFHVEGSRSSVGRAQSVNMEIADLTSRRSHVQKL